MADPRATAVAVPTAYIVVLHFPSSATFWFPGSGSRYGVQSAGLALTVAAEAREGGRLDVRAAARAAATPIRLAQRLLRVRPLPSSSTM